MTTEKMLGRYARFDLGSGRATGIIESVNTKTVMITPIKIEARQIRRVAERKQGSMIKRHVEKHNLRIFPKNVIPGEGY